ncbi:Na/Pi symporter [Roseomonas sp. SSH11]|uniref:Na/Pi symporter n=1 Tax=Pararoseomonas baculiformis TaxID=2820812 RepID=A0ABS4AIB2_9PROT|nr:Na/Pi symporter [Pararoseomonas baculiformis]MBP0446731.1 Na/Pi symporter [Pararoseomonas baculiformis]
MDLIASFLGGLGLFLAAVRGLGGQLQQMAGRRLRATVSSATRGGAGAALTGVLLGALTQSSNAVTFVAASMVQAGILPLARALPVVAWCNLGTVALVLAAALDLRVAALWLIGMAGCGLALAPNSGGRWKPALGAAFQLGLLFLGLAILKSGAGPLRDSESVRAAMELADHALLPAFLLGMVVTLVAQSSSTVTILAITLAEIGLLDGGQAGLAVCGASLGSGLSVLLLAGGLHGPARRLASFQALFKAFGALLLGLPFVLWRIFPEWPEPWAAMDLTHRLGLLFVALQLLPALLLLPAYPALPRLLERLSPARPEEALSRPKYLYEQALENVPTALDLVGREQARLLARLPQFLDRLREDGPPVVIPRATLSNASAEVERAVGSFLQEVLGRGCPREDLERAVALESLNALMANLRETTSDLAAALEAVSARDARDPIRALAPPLLEGLHMLLSELHDAARSGDPLDAETLSELAADRSAMMDSLRRRVARAGQDLPQDALGLLFRFTSLFERAVWLVRRGALLLPSTWGASNPGRDVSEVSAHAALDMPEPGSRAALAP